MSFTPNWNVILFYFLETSERVIEDMSAARPLLKGNAKKKSNRAVHVILLCHDFIYNLDNSSSIGLRLSSIVWHTKGYKKCVDWRNNLKTI